MPVAIVTGASRGIGRAIACRLASEGFDLLLVARSATGLAAVAGECRRYDGRRVESCSADLRDESTPAQVRRRLEQSFGRLDVLVNNAGLAMNKPFGSYTTEDWNEVMHLNAKAPFFLTQEMLPYLQSADPAWVINVGSVVAKKGYADQSLYAASKHALLGFTKSFARETAGSNLRVHAVLPGGVNTDMIAGVRPDIDPAELIDADEVADVVAGLIEMKGNAVIDEVEIRRRTNLPWA